MKSRIQFTPELAAALICATGCFSVWLLVCRPAALTAVKPPPRTELVRLVVNEQILNKLKAPTLFALPSETGFSGRFIEEKIERRVPLEKPEPAQQYLPMTPQAVPELNPDQLTEKTVPLQESLPVPGIKPKPVMPVVAGTGLFFSPQLKERAAHLTADAFPKTGPKESIRANLSVRADGTVASVFFDTPVTNTALLHAVRGLTFIPAANPADGWMDIRFVQKGTE